MPGRVYVHYGRVTVRVPFGAAGRTVGDAAAAFLSSYRDSDAARAAGGPPPAGVELRRGETGTALDTSALLADLCVDGDDLTAVAVRPAPPRPTQRHVAGSSVATRGLPAPVDEAEPHGGRGPASDAWQLTHDHAPAFLSRAAQLDEAKRLAAANMVYDKVLSSLGARSSHAPTCILALARNAVAIEQHDRALALLRQGVDAYPNHVSLLASLGDVLLRLDRPSDAARCLDTALRVSRGGGGGGSQGSLTTHDIEVLCARALYGAGARQQAANLVMQVLRDTQEGHIGALVEYAAVSSDQGNWADVTTSLLRVLSASPKHRDDARVQAMLAAAAGTEEGMRLLFDTVGGTGTNAAVKASALAFVASVLKDAGAVAPAATVLQRAYSASPSPGLALARAHAREACLDTCAALDALCAWFHHAAASGDAGDAPHVTWLAACTHIVGTSQQTLPALPTAPGSARYEWLFFSDAGFAAPPAVPPPARSPPGDVAPAESLDALACAFTAVKLLFCGGALSQAAALSAVASAWAAATPGGHALHESPIRNEAAYGSCIHLLLTQHPPAVPPAQPEEQPLFVLGDSHVLPCAWRTVTFRRKQRLLVPCLVTGIKAYHLRPSSCFYPKRQWERACVRLPSGSDVIVLVGEIDCREGMLRAIEKGCAPNLPAAARDAAQTLVDALVRHLLTGRSRCGAVLVHPVAPVLDVTRPIVAAFNAALGAAVARARGKHPAMTWLGGDETGGHFTCRLLTADGAALQPAYVLDGTHLHPGYVADVLQDALSACADQA